MTSVIEKARPASPERAVVTDADVLERAADLLEEFGWRQGAYGSREQGSFCMAGAFIQASLDLEGGTGSKMHSVDQHMRAGTILWESIGSCCVVDWNDATGRTKAEVVGRLRHAATRLREAQAGHWPARSPSTRSGNSSTNTSKDASPGRSSRRS